MKETQTDILTVTHRNMWGQWSFSFIGKFLCGLQFTSAEDATILPSTVKACTYATDEQDISLPQASAKTYRKAVRELNLYLAGKLQEFSVPLQILGTEFQVQVFEAVRSIPYGKTWTYKQVAEAIGHPKAERAVGNALHSNPLQVIIPCHRVVTSKGKIGGYALGSDLKRRLLCMEGAIQNELDLE